MHTPVPARLRRALTTTALLAVTGLLAACSGDPAGGMPGMDPGMDHGSTPHPTSAAAMPDMVPGDGLTASAAGFTFVPSGSTLPAGQPVPFRFRITGADGTPATRFVPDQTMPMHFYLIRSDLTGFQHLHPEPSADGTWTVPVRPLLPGTYRAYTSFVVEDGAGKPQPLVLSAPITVPGPVVAQPLPPASPTTTVDGYTLALSGEPGTAGMLTVTVSKDGVPVTDLQPYLGTYAHLTAFHQGDLAFAHLHPNGPAASGDGGPTLSFHAELPQPGNWRLFVQFQTAGTLHTAAVTLTS